jgi:hypothetical protein
MLGEGTVGASLDWETRRLADYTTRLAKKEKSILILKSQIFEY